MALRDGYSKSSHEDIIVVQVDDTESLSDAFYIGDGHVFVSVQTPATAQLDEIGFEKSLDSTDGTDGTFAPVYDSAGNLLTLTASTSQVVTAGDAGAKAWSLQGWLKLRTRQTSANQAQSQDTIFRILISR